MPNPASGGITPQRDKLYIVGTVNDLQRIGMEVQNIATPSRLTASMVKNLCINGWTWSNTYTAEEVREEADEVISELGWNAGGETFKVKRTTLDNARDPRRTVLPIFRAGEETGYYGCIVDHGSRDGKVVLDVRGFAFGANRKGLLDAAKHLDDKSDGSFGEPEFTAVFAAGYDPLQMGAGHTPEQRWVLVPEDTPIADITSVLDKYVAEEPAL